jgi:hypothetical protein
MLYEPRLKPPISREKFLHRLALHFAAALVLLMFSLALGMTGYMYFESLSAVDAFLNASMLLGGMGPVDAPHSQAGKIFAGCYALYAGLVFIGTAALIFAPVIHRLMHRFHWDERTK